MAAPKPECTSDSDCSKPGSLLWLSTDTERACITGKCTVSPRDPQVNGGTIAAIVLVCLVGLALLLAVSVLFVKRRHRAQAHDVEMTETALWKR